ncbi:CPBP family intramembrane glutamic endopeptidase [Lysinibacillus sp. BW-2-10]|uniref:CPBP family intramembrane glutamic endopeptidase n=1 Tax=Lysinibacillus sp. BW-2-10 TaxID=2590030 RepID=UPI0011815272|nr:type II CAAX endopeptidase family protein [Lysinibacillus sp. BW-2-10]TSI04523.1 CPBP family intramembrane metalloprotease [Lysinibacillus sp. BW-2-10]
MSTLTKLQTQKTAFYVLITYVIFQVSGFILVIPPIREFFLQFIHEDGINSGIALAAWWSSMTAGIAFIVCLILINRNKNFWNVFNGEKASIPVSIGWGIIGFFLVYFGQIIGAYIEAALGIKAGSENTETIMLVTEVAPIMMLATVFFGPILEEFVFRRVVFGSLIQTQSFWVAGLISSIIFAAIHLDFTHIILYTISGFVFAFLYYKTKRILTSIIAHMLLNGVLTILTLNIDKLQQISDQLTK